MDFIIAGVAAVGAGFFTNPLEVLKTRMQLQGELHAKGEYTVHYKNTIHATYTIIKHDGILSLQKGLSPALWVQFILNGVRLGIYQTLEDCGYVLDKEGNTIFYKSVIVGGIGGVAGQYASSPVFLVKTHLQTQSSESIAVGYQHKHTSMLQAMKIIFNEHGVGIVMQPTLQVYKGLSKCKFRRNFVYIINGLVWFTLSTFTTSHELKEWNEISPFRFSDSVKLCDSCCG